MDARALLTDMRYGARPSPEALAWVAGALADGRMSDAQAGAFAMGVCRNGLDPEGRVALTLAMRDSGDTLAWDLPGPTVDKHSTGGLGDCVSLVLAPALAACGLYCPMISGRGLGHTGGTLDKLEAIPGFRTDFPVDDLRRLTAEVGCAIVSASGDIAPADKRLYAIRDVTGTVATIDLIVPSILSKKLAGGCAHLVFDVKCGSGAFMEDLASARDLARALVDTAKSAGVPSAALITAMDQPLALSLGNALEVTESLACLHGAEGRLRDLTVALGAECLAVAGEADGAARIAAALDSGAAMEVFARMVAAQGGRLDEGLPRAPVVRVVTASEAGAVAAMDGKALGMAVVRLGGGRMRDGDAVDPGVGLSGIVRLGAQVAKGDPLVTIHAADEAGADMAEAAVRAAITLGDAAPQELVMEKLV